MKPRSRVRSFPDKGMPEMLNFKRIISVSVFLFVISFGAAQTSSTPKQKITIKLLNGRTGHAVWWRGLATLRIGRAISRTELDAIDKRTNFFGEAEVDVTDANPRQIQMWADFISRDCRYSPEAPASHVYSIDEIQAKGIVSENYCGGPRRAPKPGVLMIYVIPSTLRELWNN
jgi:hypothetical protein